MAKRNAYILLSEECEILATETSLKKVVEKYSEKLLAYKYLSRLLNKAHKETGEKEVTFTGKDGNEYKLAVRRLQ